VAETWQSASPAEVDWDAAALARVLAFAREHRSTGMVMLHLGRILAEEYWTVPGVVRPATDASGRPVEDVASVQKSVVAALIGIAIERKLIDLDAPVSRYLGPGWSKASTAQEGAIAVRHLMSMTSGLDESLAYAQPPGERWFYNTPAYSTLITALARASGHAPNVYTAEWLLGRIGAVDTRWIERAPGGPNPYGLATTARDLARFGLLMLAEGRWRETSIVPRAFLRDVLRPSQTLNPSYGLLWW
jgi:CubicO group peptidase (beta-lactamase class C family)